MCIDTDRQDYYRELLDVALIYFGLEGVTHDPSQADYVLSHRFSQRDGQWSQQCALYFNGERVAALNRQDAAVDGDKILRDRFGKRYAKLCLYNMLKVYFGFSPPWGGLTGIRPTKLARQLADEGMVGDAAIQYMRDVFDVSEQKLDTVREIHVAQEGIYQTGDDRHVDVYVGIPFCRTRCVYCSFFSALAKDAAQLDAYTAALCREIMQMGMYLQLAGKKTRAVYVGGGTPTALGNDRLGRVLDALGEAFPGAWELTVEAGRPDTIDAQTFPMLKSRGVGRVSINPQTMNDRSLAIIGREHSARDILRAYDWAKSAGIANINMDIIVGLPGETQADVEHSLDELGRLDIDNLTVHTLALKRASPLRERLGQYALPDDTQAQDMLDMAREHAHSRGMWAYYLYRQKYMRGNLENVGYARPGRECAYNVDMMEETHHIVGLGAGSMCKRMYFDRALHTRQATVKDVTCYLRDHERIIEEKKQFFAPE